VSPEARGAEGAPGPAVYAAALALVLLLHLFFLFTGMTPVLDGQLPDPDSYMRLLRVTHLYETGDWFDGTLPRSNWPYGESQHWTRPADVLLLSGALALKPLLGFDRALFWWGSATAPLLHMAAALALAWAAAPLFPPARRLLVVLALLVQIPIWLYGIFGRTDHHMLIILVFILALGGTVRMMAQPMRPRVALLAGAAAGLGLWLSVEFLVFLAVIFGALTLGWIRSGERRARANLWHAAGLMLVTLLAVVTERPPTAWMVQEYDRISVVHLLVAVLAGLFWSGASSIEHRTAWADSPAKRLIVATLGALAAGAVMLAVYPKFFLGPYVDYNLDLWPISTDITKEVQPLVPTDRASLGSLLLHLGPALLAVPYLCARTLRARGANLWDGWLLVALGLLAYLPLTIAMRRFSPYAAVLLALVIADLAGLRFGRMSTARGGARRLLSMALMVAVLFGPMALSGLLLQRAGAQTSPSAGAQGCPLTALIAEINRPQGLGRTPLAVLWSPNHGPRILYETPHAVITTLYPRNARGQLDAYAIYTATDWDTARALVAERGVDLIVTCIRTPTYGARSGAPGMLDTELRRGVFPPWLEPVALGAAAGRYFRVYRTVLPAR
jgi:hypothetical protein